MTKCYELNGKIAKNSYQEIGIILGSVLKEKDSEIDYYYGISFDGEKWFCKAGDINILANNINEYFNKGKQ